MSKKFEEFKEDFWRNWGWPFIFGLLIIVTIFGAMLVYSIVAPKDIATHWTERQLIELIDERIDEKAGKHE